MFVVRSSEYAIPSKQKGLSYLERKIPHALLESHIKFASVITYPYATNKVVERLTPYTEFLYLVHGRTRYAVGDDHELRMQEISAGELFVVPPNTIVREHAVEPETKIFRLALPRRTSGESFSPIHCSQNSHEIPAEEHVLLHDTVDGAAVLIGRGVYAGRVKKEAKRSAKRCTTYFIIGGNGMIAVGEYDPDPIHADDTAFVPPALSHSIITFDEFPLEFLRIDIQ